MNGKLIRVSYDNSRTGVGGGFGIGIGSGDAMVSAGTWLDLRGTNGSDVSEEGLSVVFTVRFGFGKL